MTAEQVNAWFAAADQRLEALKGPFHFWGQATPMLVRFCDGHGLHQVDLNELRSALSEAKDRLLARQYSEDGPAFGVTVRQAFIEIFCIIANAQRVEGKRNEVRDCDG
ncbi:MAG: hypothetical protein L6R45_29810 [Anaerolineae bacterium]|nr:hypothetical protein [Anaerolineae bacterium]